MATLFDCFKNRCLNPKAIEVPMSMAIMSIKSKVALFTSYSREAAVSIAMYSFLLADVGLNAMVNE